MTVYLVSYVLPPDRLSSGCSKHVQNLYDELKKNGVDTTVITTSKRDNRDIKCMGFPFAQNWSFIVIKMLLFSLLSTCYALKENIWKKGAIVHTHGGGTHLIGILCKLLFGNRIKFVMTQHSTKLGKLCHGRHACWLYAFLIIEAVAYRFADRVICVSNMIKKECLQLGCKESKTVVISNFVDADKIAESKAGDYFLYVGNDNHIKGFDIIKNVYKCNNKDITLKLKAAGALKQEDIPNIEFCGWIEGKEKEELFKNCYALLLPSRYDACPTVALEALSYGKPVICFDTGGHAEIVMSNKCGLVCDNVSEDCFMKNMLLLINNREMYKSFRKNCYATAHRFFWKNGIDNIMDVYDRVKN